jgi:hypothetical protein
MSDVNVMRKRARTIFSDGINKYFLSFLCVYGLIRELNRHTVYSVYDSDSIVIYVAVKHFAICWKLAISSPLPTTSPSHMPSSRSGKNAHHGNLVI